MRSVFQFAARSRRAKFGAGWLGSPKWLFFRRFLAHPGELGSVTPSSEVLGELIARQVRCEEDEFVVELGAGTGAVTGAILSAGIPADRLVVVEIDKQMAHLLRKSYPGVTVVEGDAFDLKQVLPDSVIGKVGTVICGMPISILPLQQQRDLITLILSLMPTGRSFLQYTYRIMSPLPARKVGLNAKRLAFTLQNIPPASVWAYEANGKRP